jgi:hypothetical protein
LWPSGEQVVQSHAGKGVSLCTGKDTSNTNHVRLWRPLATEEAKQQWWSEATFSFRDVFREIYETEPTIRRGDDGVSKGLDKDRVKRIKALGNTIVPQIAELIGNCILDYENRSTSNVTQ